MTKTKIIALLCSVLITGICFYFCRDMLSTRIIPVTFSVQSNVADEFIFTAIYSHDEKNPKKNKTETKVNLKQNEWKFVKIILPLPKGMLQNFSLSIKSQRHNKYSIKLEKFKLRNKDVFETYSLDKLNLSKTLTATKDKISNDIFILTSQAKEGNITFKDHLNLKRHRDWNIYACVIFFIVIFSSSYIVVKFLLNTRILQKEHTANIVFIIVLFLTLFFPTSKIDHVSTKSSNENRVLAQYKSLFSGEPLKPESNFNRNYGKDFEAWFNDRFRGREKLVSLENEFKYKLTLNTYKNKKGAYRYNDWVWMRSDWIIPNESNIKKINNTLNDIYKNWNIPIIALVYPAKSEIYCEHSLSKKCDYGSDKIFNYLKKNINNEHIKVISALPYALKHKNDKELLFYKDEHHMTQYGNQMIINELIVDGHLPASNNNYQQYGIQAHCTDGEFGFDKKRCETNIKYGQAYAVLRGGNKRSIHDDKMDNEGSYVYYSFSNNFKNDVKYKHTLLNQKNIGYTNLYNSNKNVANFTPMLIGNSFVETLSLALITRYDHVIRFRLNAGSPNISIYKMTNEVHKDKPDVIIATIYSDNILRAPSTQ